MAPSNKLILTRDQIAAFATDPRAIKQIESLFTLAQGIQELNVEGIAIDAGAALAGVNKLTGAVAQLTQDGAIEASNALAIAQAAERALNAVSELAMIGATLPPGVPRRRNVGAWVSTVDQAPLLVNTAYPVTLSAASVERGVWRDSVNTSRIYVADAGVYNFETSMQLDKMGGGAPQIWIWARVDGVDVPDSASLIHLQGASDETVFAANWLLNLAANSYFEIIWASDDTSSRLEYFPAAAPVPAIPSVILTATQEA